MPSCGDEKSGPRVDSALRALRPEPGGGLRDVLAAVRRGLGLRAAQGPRIGRYRLDHRIGRGGCGVVFRATDLALHRSVAIKLVGASPGADLERSQARLAREARVLARLDHTSIVKVFHIDTYELVVEDASPAGICIVMELVQGRDLRQWFDEAPPPDRVLETMLAAGRGLAAAHDVGIVHRDFKPGNVLLGDDGSIKVADFGLARHDGEDEVSPNASTIPSGDAVAPRSVEIVGTPVYMAPEQYAGQADARSDQFAFCAALFEGLTGRRAFGRADPEEDRRRKQAGDIRGASLLPRRVRGAICRGLHPDPAQRFASMHELLAALQRRRRWALPVLVVLGLTTTVLPSIMPSDAAPCDTAVPWSDARAAAIGRALRVANPAAAESAATVVRDLDAQAEALRLALADACTAEPIVRDCLHASLAAFDRTASALEHADAALAERAVAFVDLLEPVSACAHAGSRRLPPPPDDRAAAVADVRFELTRSTDLLNETRVVEAEAALAPLTQHVERIGYAPLHAELMGMQGMLAARGGRPRDAAELYEQSYWEAAELGHDRQMMRAAMGLAETHGLRLHDFEAARVWERHAASALSRSGDTSARRLLDNLSAGIRIASGRWEEAVALLEASLSDVDEAAPGSTHLTIMMLHNLGAAYGRTGRFAEAEATLQRALSHARARLGSTHPQTASTVAQLGVLRARQDDYTGAEARAREALAKLEAWSPEPHPWQPQILGNLGAALGNLERYEEAEQAYARAIEVARALGGEATDVTALREGLELARSLREEAR